MTILSFLVSSAGTQNTIPQNREPTQKTCDIVFLSACVRYFVLTILAISVVSFFHSSLYPSVQALTGFVETVG